MTGRAETRGDHDLAGVYVSSTLTELYSLNVFSSLGVSRTSTELRKNRRPNRPGCTFRPPQAPPLPRKSSEGTTGHSPGARPPLSLSPRGRLLLEPRHASVCYRRGRGRGTGDGGRPAPRAQCGHRCPPPIAAPPDLLGG